MRKLAAAGLAAMILGSGSAASAQDPGRELVDLLSGWTVDTGARCGVSWLPDWNRVRCLRETAADEFERLAAIEGWTDDAMAQDPDADWSEVDSLLSRRRTEVEALDGKIAVAVSLAEGYDRVLDQLANPPQPYNPYAPGPYGPPAYRRDSSVSAPGVR